MKRIKFALPLILLVLGVIYYFSFQYVYTAAIDNIIKLQIETSKNQATLISNLLTEKLNAGFSKEQVKNELQRSIENSSTEYSFVCMFDDLGTEICHPNKNKIGKVLLKNNSIIKSVANVEVENNFKDAIMQKKAIGGLRTLKNYTEIVYLSPVKNANWIVASHANVLKFRRTFNSLKEKLLFIFLLVWLSSTFIIYFFLQKINLNNLEDLKSLNETTSKQYLSELELLNKKLTKPVNTNRLLVNKGYQLTPVFTKDIAFVYTENKISYVVDLSKEKYTINLTLDEIFKILDSTLFYRASRQVIVSAKSIDKIEKYGNTQLKVITNPISPIEIIISKAKLTDFKKWVGKN